MANKQANSLHAVDYYFIQSRLNDDDRVQFYTSLLSAQASLCLFPILTHDEFSSFQVPLAIYSKWQHIDSWARARETPRRNNVGRASFTACSDHLFLDQFSCTRGSLPIALVKFTS